MDPDGVSPAFGGQRCRGQGRRQPVGTSVAHVCEHRLPGVSDQHRTAERVELVESVDEFERFGEADTSILLINWADDHAVFHRMHTKADEAKIRNQILFREYLREHPDARREYEEVKREAVKNHADDPGDYTKAKSDIVADLLQRAESAGYEKRLPDYLQSA